ncbi:MAG TPA: DUF4386 domain-containing protein [Caulobacteraceae bacterium]|nr:DUF4386 domain-containing protein [Caulobacteraceae bacterium]
MQSLTIESSPRFYARLAGAIYLLIILFGGFSEGYVMNTLVVSGDPAATAHNIMASSTLWRFSVAGDLIVPLIAVPQLWIIYHLLKPAGRELALLFVLLEIVSLSVESVSKLFLLLVLPMLENAGYGHVFQSQQLFALTGMILSAHDTCFDIALLFFGADCLVTGYLIFRSGYFPRLIGLLLQLAGLSYLIGTLSVFFAPALASMISLPVQLLALIGEASFCLWLLVMGVNVPKWNERLGRAA